MPESSSRRMPLSACVLRSSVLPERRQEVAPPQPHHADELGHFRSVPHRMVRAQARKAPMGDGDQRAARTWSELDLDLGAFAGREVRAAPLEDQARWWVPPSDGPSLEDPGGSAGLERLVEPTAEARLEMDEAAVLAGNTVLEAAAPPLIDLLGEDPKRRLWRDCDEDR